MILDTLYYVPSVFNHRETSLNENRDGDFVTLNVLQGIVSLLLTYKIARTENDFLFRIKHLPEQKSETIDSNL